MKSTKLFLLGLAFVGVVTLTGCTNPHASKNVNNTNSTNSINTPVNTN